MANRAPTARNLGTQAPAPSAARTSTALVSAPPPSAVQSAAPTREDCWNKLNETWASKKTPDELETMWHEILQSQGKPEGDFTPGDWSEVLAAAETPF